MERTNAEERTEDRPPLDRPGTAGPGHLGADADADSPPPRSAAEAGQSSGPAEETGGVAPIVVEAQIGVSWVCACGKPAGAPGEQLAMRLAMGQPLSVRAKCCGATIVLKKKPDQLVQPVKPFNRETRRQIEAQMRRQAAKQKGIGLVGPNGRPL